VATAGLEIINIQPQVIATNLRFASYNAQGAREEKKSLFSFEGLSLTFDFKFLLKP
jgi:hypothetical protein